MQKYCEKCSEQADLTRKKLWAKANPQKTNPIQAKELRSRTKLAGIAISKLDKVDVTYAIDRPNLLWLVRVSVPFSYSSSKNAIYALRASGHVALRKEARDWRDQLRDRLRDAVSHHTVVQNKVWLDILVEKPDHKGDAVNVVDSVCDGVKEAIGVDDRWFCIRQLDWRISKNEPKLILGVGQSSDENLQPCSSCGRLLPFPQFTKKSNSRHGIGRNCKDCRTIKK